MKKPMRCFHNQESPVAAKRLVYNGGPEKGGPNQEAVAAAAEQKIQKEAAETTEKAIKGLEMSADDAVNLAKKNIDSVAKGALDNVKDDAQSRKRINEAKDVAFKQIDGNMERYGKMAAFAKKNVEMSLTLDSNEDAFAKYKDNTDITTSRVLNDVANALDLKKTEISAMDAPGMETEKTVLLKDIGEQSKKFGDKSVAILKQVIDSINKEDDLLAKVEVAPELASAGTFLKLQEHIQFLLDLKGSLQDVAGERELKGPLDDKIKKIQAVLTPVNERLGKSDPDWEKAREKYYGSAANLKEAKENLEKVEERKGFPGYAKDVVEAKGWLEGAQKQYDTDRNALEEISKRIDKPLPPPETAPAA